MISILVSLVKELIQLDENTVEVEVSKGRKVAIGDKVTRMKINQTSLLSRKIFNRMNQKIKVI